MKGRSRAAVVAVAGTVLVGAAFQVPVLAGAKSRTPVCTPVQIVSRWSTQRLVEQLLAPSVDQSSLTVARGVVADGIGGLVLTGNAPMDLMQQLRLLISTARSGLGPFIMADEEGGEVQRLAPLVQNIPAARTMGATMTSKQIQEVGATAGGTMHRLGLTMDLAPVADVDARPGPDSVNADGTRSFSGVTTVVTRDANAFSRGLSDSGVIPVIKHFPGLGGAEGNSDLGVSRTLGWPNLLHIGLPPFIEAIKQRAPVIMISNAIVPGLSTLPASLSRAVITDELRNKLHYQGLVMTDSLSAVSITAAGYSLSRAAVVAFEAGADFILFNVLGSALRPTVASIDAAVNTAVSAKRLSRDHLIAAAARVLALKHVARCAASA